MKILKKRVLLFCSLIGLVLTLCAFGLFTSVTVAKAANEYPGLSFSLINNSKEYGVSAGDTSITEALIPAYYNGKPVTEIEAYGFMFCADLTMVEVPETVKIVDDSAFYGCENLIDVCINVVDGKGLAAIGEYAFAYTNLNYTILPNTVKPELVGEYAFDGIPEENLMYIRQEEGSPKAIAMSQALNNFAGETIYGIDNIALKKITGKEEYAIQKFQNLTITDTNGRLEVPLHNVGNKDSTNDDNLPITEVSGGAFNGTELKIVEFTTCQNCADHKIELKTNAFANSKIKQIILNNNVILTANGTLAGAPELETVVLPSNITQVPENMFNNSPKLKQFMVGNNEPNHLPTSITSLGKRAFNKCTGLSTIYIDGLIQTMGDNIFQDWTTSQKININLPEEPSAWGKAWNGSAVIPQYLNNYIMLKANAPAASDLNIYLEPHKTFDDLLKHEKYSEPKSPGNIFLGWYKESDCLNKVALTEKFTSNTILYAGWNGESEEKDFYDVVLESNDYVTFSPDKTTSVAKNGSFSFSVTINEPYTQTEDSTDTKIAIYYNDVFLGSGAGNYNLAPITRDVKITSDSAELNTYDINFYENADKKSTEKFSYGSNLSWTDPNRDGCSFSGWNSISDGSGDYYTKDYIVKDELTVYAIWKTTVTFKSNGGSAVDSITVKIGDSITLPASSYSTKYYGLWNNIHRFGDSYEVTAPISFTISWRERSILESTDRYIDCFNEQTGCYEIWTQYIFEQLRYATLTNKSYMLMSNINLGVYTPMTYFNGNFEGRGYTITYTKDMSYNRDIGLWEQNAGTINNLRVQASNVIFMTATDRGVGIIAGVNFGTIISCTTLGQITTYAGTIGGIAGINKGTITNCRNEATIIGARFIGGIAGENYFGKINYCYNYGKINVEYGSFPEIFAGGIVGKNTGGELFYDTNYGVLSYVGKSTLEINYAPYISYIVGCAFGGNISYYNNYGSLNTGNLQSIYGWEQRKNCGNYIG